MENDPPQRPGDENVDARQLGKAMRFAFAVIVLFFIGICLRSSLAIEGFDRIFKDMLGNKPLPPLTSAIIATQPALVGLNVLLLALITACCFLRNLVRSFYFLGGLAFIGIVELVILYYGLSGVLLTIVSSLGCDSGA